MLKSHTLSTLKLITKVLVSQSFTNEMASQNAPNGQITFTKGKLTLEFHVCITKNSTPHNEIQKK